MQNKANFRKSQVNVKSFQTSDYDDFCRFELGKNKANSKPNKANFKTEDRRQKTEDRRQMMERTVKSGLTRDYENKLAEDPKKANNNPIGKKRIIKGDKK